MSLRFLLTRLAMVAVTGALLTAAAVTPAAGTGDRDDTPTPTPAPTATWNTGTSNTGSPHTGTPAPGASTPGPGPQQTQPPSDGPGNGPRFYRGVVTARGGLALHTRPDRGGKALRVARQGEVVWIYCKTAGDTVGGNPRWYLLADGAWAWGAARYIDTVGPAPRWC
ncbi:SH3 domain-containing protein [Streptomyces carpinensis]|uniref:SH3 domain-containing protein n=1 Tax=Streptomyces carpinensis TaxID=66369 RepID=A0ABV1W9W3_9ACTN